MFSKETEWLQKVDDLQIGKRARMKIKQAKII